MFTHSGMFTTSSSVHDLVIVVAFIGALLSGYAGMTVWSRKAGKGFLVGGLLGVLGVLILVLGKPEQAEIDSAAQPGSWLTVRTAVNSSTTRRGFAGVTSRLRPRPGHCDRWSER